MQHFRLIHTAGEEYAVHGLPGTDEASVRIDSSRDLALYDFLQIPEAWLSVLAENGFSPEDARVVVSHRPVAAWFPQGYLDGGGEVALIASSPAADGDLFLFYFPPPRPMVRAGGLVASAANQLLSALIKKIGAKTGEEVYQQFFPDDFKASVQKSFEDLARGIAAIKDEISRVLLQSTERSLNRWATYFTETLEPFLGLYMKDGPPPADLDSYTQKLVSATEELTATLNDATRDLSQRVKSCDYPARRLYELLKIITALNMAYFYWRQQFVRRYHPGDSRQLALIEQQYQQFRQHALATITEYQPKLESARIALMTFSYEVEQFPGKITIRSVQCTYKDEFSSSFPEDPFRGDKIDNHLDYRHGSSGWDYLFPDTHGLDQAARADQWKKENTEHQAAVRGLVDQHITKPTREYLATLAATPANLTDLLKP